MVLKMTGDTFMLSTVLALVGVPRALFMLIGGALVDHYSPKRVVILTKYINTLLLGSLAFLVLSHNLSIRMIDGLSLAIRVVTAFSIPSRSGILPHVVKIEQLHSATSMMLGLQQVTMFTGPLLADLLITLFSEKNSGVAFDSNGLGVLLMLDTLSFAISAWMFANKGVIRIPYA
ncbi:hypothetical protein Q2T72_06010 [Yersinia sp. 2466 StPb PI]